MKQYAAFIVDSFSFDPASGRIELRYSLDDELTFTETILLPSPLPSRGEGPGVGAALFALHLIGGISYYKTCLPTSIEIRSGKLTEKQAAFWNGVYENGLGEFFYKNDIDFRGLIRFPSLLDQSPPHPDPLPLPGGEGGKRKILVPIGGGKDSVVTAELLRKAGHDVTLLRMGHHPLITELAEKMTMPLLTVERRLDPLLFKLNTEGALNGHVPITGYLSFLTIIIAELFGFDAVALSNERSANEGNVEFHGKQINHQWSKSLEFERDFQKYVEENITGNVSYFSLLRPLSELHIARLFALYPQYFSLTTSCNKNWKIIKTPPLPRTGEGAGGWGLWCGQCPKCAFVFALYSAFLDQKTLITIFGKNLFDDQALLPLYRELLGLKGIKPFECVGTPEETKAALLLAHRRGDCDDTVIMKMFLTDVLPKIKDPDAMIEDALTPSEEQAIPEEFQSILRLS